MSIDLYLAGNCKEIMTDSHAKSISFGWGMNRSGQLRRPEEYHEAQPIIIDDSIIATVSPSFTQALLPFCKNGCVLDFERQPGNFHFALLSLLRKHKVKPLWVPKSFHVYVPEAEIMISCDLPHNSWKQFCSAQQKQYQNKWVLEYQPLHLVKNMPDTKNKEDFFLPEAICMAKIKDHQLFYYDTKQTVIKKLLVAEQYGCQGMIGIQSEWESLKK